MAYLQPEAALPHVEDAAIEAENEDLEIDITDSGYGLSANAEVTSLASVYQEYIENGRRYQNADSKEYYQPSDEESWAAMDKGHLIFQILDSKRENPYFRSPVTADTQNIIDVGCGSGQWALDVADQFPNLSVRGIDRFPPPRPFTAPNCIFEVDDVTLEWTYRAEFDLLHIRNLLGVFNEEEWRRVYEHAYIHTKPGGWIEHVEQDTGIFCDDDSLPQDSILRTWKKVFIDCAECSGRPLNTFDTMKARIEAAGYVNVQSIDYKLPIGLWPKLQLYKDAGRVVADQFRYGSPEPWTAEQFRTWCAKIMKDLDKGYHVYNKARRVWAQKPYDAAPTGPPRPQHTVIDLTGESPAQPSSKKQRTEE